MGTPLPKAGHDQSQDRRINDLERKNTDEHHTIREQVVAGFERVEGKLTMHRTVAIIAWMIITAMGGYILQLHTSRLEDIADTMKDTAKIMTAVDKRQDAWEARATEWGENLEHRDNSLERKHERDFDKIENKLEQLRRNTSRH